MGNTNKLWRVTLRGLTSSSGLKMKISYCVATNSDAAYKMVRQWLDQNDYGFPDERALDSIELLAEDACYTETRTRLFLAVGGS